MSNTIYNILGIGLFCQQSRKSSCISVKFMLKNLEGIDNCCTFALAFAQKSGLRHKRKEFFERFT